jgi:predicted RNase H-like HicB family nuclease
MSDLTKRYGIAIIWSEPDQEWFAEVPDFGSFSASGPTPEEALRELLFALEGLEEAIEADGGTLPEPGSRWPRATWQGRFAVSEPSERSAVVLQR